MSPMIILSRSTLQVPQRGLTRTAGAAGDGYAGTTGTSTPLFYRPSMMRLADAPPSHDPDRNPDLRGPNFAGTPNLGIVTPQLFRGAQPDAGGFSELKAGGVKTIIDLQANHTDVPDMLGNDLDYCNIPCHAFPAEQDHVLDFLKIATNPEHQPVFVHCAQGKDRTGMMIATYRIVIENWSKQRALAELEAYGFHDVFQDVKQYVDKLDPDQVRAQLATHPEPPVVHIH